MTTELGRSVTLAQAKKKYRSTLEPTHHRVEFGARRVLVHDGSLRVAGDLRLDELVESFGAFIITGDLTVEGSLFDLTSTPRLILEVRGATAAKNVLAGASHITLWGPVKVENVFFTHSHVGYVKVMSRLTACSILRGGANVDFEGPMQGTYVNVGKGECSPLVARFRSNSRELILKALVKNPSSRITRATRTARQKK